MPFQSPISSRSDRRPVLGLTRAALAAALSAAILMFASARGAVAQDLPSLDQLFAPTPTPGSANPTPNPPPQPVVEGLPGLESLIPGSALTPPTLSNTDLNSAPPQGAEVQAAVERQARRRAIDDLLSRIRENFARGEFNQVLELVKQAEGIEPENANIKFYKDWATKKIRTGEGPRGSIVNNPRLASGLSTPDPSIPTPRSTRTPLALATPPPTPTPLPTPQPTPDLAAAPPPPVVPTVVPAQGGFFADYGPILVAVSVGLIVVAAAAYFLGHRAPLPVAPKIQYQPVPILPNLLAQAPVDAMGATATQRDMRQTTEFLDPQTLAVEEDEPPSATPPPAMAEFPGIGPGAFGQIGIGLASTNLPPVNVPEPAAPHIDVLPTVPEGHDDTMYAIDDEPADPLATLHEEVDALEATAYDFYEARTQELSLHEHETTQFNPGPLPPSSFGLNTLDDIERTIPVGGPLPPSRFDFPAAGSVAPPTAAPLPPASPDSFSYDPDITLPAPSALPPSRFDLPAAPATNNPLPAPPSAPVDGLLPTPLVDLPLTEESETPVPRQLLGVFPGKAKAAESPSVAPPPPGEAIPLPAAAPAAMPASVAVPSLPPGNESVIDLGSFGFSLNQQSSAPTPEPPKPKPAPEEPAISALEGLGGQISLAPESAHPDDQLAATADFSPYQYKPDTALGATKTFEVGSDSIYGNPTLSEAEQSAEMVRQELARGDAAAARGDWKKAVHCYSIAASLQTDHPELLAKLRHAREMKKANEG